MKHTPITRKRLRAFVGRLHAKGFCDAEIACEWNEKSKPKVSREWCGAVRRQLKLPSNRGNERYRKRVADITKEQCKKAGVKSLRQIQIQKHREFIEASGWPKDLRIRAVQILNLLYEHGPKTRRQIAEACGFVWHGPKTSLLSNDPEGTYLANLQARGLVQAMKRAVKGCGKGKSVWLYMVPIHVKRHL